MSLLSRSIFALLGAVVVSGTGNFTNGAASLYPKMGSTVPLSDRFDIIRNSDFVRNLTAARKVNRNTKLENLEQWLRGYTSDKYDLINMYDRMLTIQSRAKYIMTYPLNRMAILKVEMLRSNLDKIVGKQNKLNYVLNITYGDFPDYYFKPVFYYFDFDWQQDYNSTKWLPAHQVFVDYYFPTAVQTILNNTKLTVDQRIQTIDYKKFQFLMSDGEATALKLYYKNFLTSSNTTTSGK